MEYRKLGRAGVKVSAIGLGTNRFGTKVTQKEVDDIIARAAELGVNFLDTADVYGGGKSEETLGRALEGRWSQFVLASKGYFRMGEGPNDMGASRYHLQNAVEASLKRLRSDHIDLYQMHRWDADTPIDETLRTLDDLITQGKIRYIGASNYAAWQLAQADRLAEVGGWEAFATVQSHYHMLERDIEKEVIPYCRAAGIGFIPFFPLAGGFLTGKYKADQPPPAGSRGEESAYVQRYMTPDNYAKVAQLQAWAEARDRTMAQLAEAWLLAQPTVCSVISGVTRLSHLESNAAAADWALSDEDMAAVEGILTGGDDAEANAG